MMPIASSADAVVEEVERRLAERAEEPRGEDVEVEDVQRVVGGVDAEERERARPRR